MPFLRNSSSPARLSGVPADALLRELRMRKKGWANEFGWQTAAGEHESSIKSNDSLTKTNGTEQGNENPFPRDFNDSM